MKIVLKIVLAMVFCFILVLPALAGDLQVSVNSAEGTITIHNLLDTGVYILRLVSGSTMLDLNVEVGAGSDVVFSHEGDMPSVIDFATCLPGAGSQGSIPGHQIGSDGFYRLSVDLI